jgi:hypothetical protein
MPCPRQVHDVASPHILGTSCCNHDGVVGIPHAASRLCQLPAYRPSSPDSTLETKTNQTSGVKKSMQHRRLTIVTLHPGHAINRCDATLLHLRFIIISYNARDHHCGSHNLGAPAYFRVRLLSNQLNNFKHLLPAAAWRPSAAAGRALMRTWACLCVGWCSPGCPRRRGASSRCPRAQAGGCSSSQQQPAAAASSIQQQQQAAVRLSMHMRQWRRTKVDRQVAWVARHHWDGCSRPSHRLTSSKQVQRHV